MTLKATIVKHGLGHSVELVPEGDTWQHGQKSDGVWGQHALLTAPELDRLIAALCKARDACRNANRPKPSWGAYRT